MPRRYFRQFEVLCLAAALVGWSFVSSRLPATSRVPLQAVVGALLALGTRAPLGLRPPRVWAGLRAGALAGVGAAAAIAATTLLPPVRLAMAGREPPTPVPVWLLWRIPVGTVWAEESAFRAALANAGSGALGATGGRLLQAFAFGLFHIADARAMGEPLVPTVAVTGIGGWLFGWLADRSGSLAAPMLAHLAVNEAGAIAALTARRSVPRLRG